MGQNVVLSLLSLSCSESFSCRSWQFFAAVTFLTWLWLHIYQVFTHCIKTFETMVPYETQGMLCALTPTRLQIRGPDDGVGGERRLSSCQLWYIVASSAASPARCQNERGEGPREVIVSGHGTLGFLASGLYVEPETRLTRWAGKVRNCAT